MHKLLLVLTTVMLLSGCDPSARNTTDKYVLPEGLKDCVIYDLRNTGGGSIIVTRCPLSSTTTAFSSGKTTGSVVVIEAPKPKLRAVVVDGVTYEEKQ